MRKLLNTEDISRIIEMAWEDRTPFEAIETLYNINEAQLIRLMRSSISLRSFKRWRERVTARKTKHLKLRPKCTIRAYCPTQYKHK